MKIWRRTASQYVDWMNREAIDEVRRKCRRPGGTPPIPSKVKPIQPAEAEWFSTAVATPETLRERVALRLRRGWKEEVTGRTWRRYSRRAKGESG